MQFYSDFIRTSTCIPSGCSDLSNFLNGLNTLAPEVGQQIGSKTKKNVVVKKLADEHGKIDI